MDKSKIVNPVLMWFIIIAGIVSAVLFFSGKKLSDLILLKLLFIPAAAYWLYFFVQSIKIHRQAARSVAKINRLVTQGVYGMVRHPIYSADIMLFWGIYFYLQTLAALLSAAWLTIVMFLWMKLEEKFLLKKFGEQYKKYQTEVPMFLPKFKK